MDLTITLLNGESLVLTVQPNDTVGRLKQLIQDKLGIAISSQRLIYDKGSRRELSEDRRPLVSYGLRPGSALSLLVTACLQVFLRNEKGQVNTYDIAPDETVDAFKKRVTCREGVPESQQRLVYQGKEMNGGKLSDYHVEAMSTIDLLLRLRGGWGHRCNATALW